MLTGAQNSNYNMKTRVHRTSEQMLADLEAQKVALQAKVAVDKMSDDEAVKGIVSRIRNLDAASADAYKGFHGNDAQQFGKRKMGKLLWLQEIEAEEAAATLILEYKKPAREFLENLRNNIATMRANGKSVEECNTYADSQIQGFENQSALIDLNNRLTAARTAHEKAVNARKAYTTSLRQPKSGAKGQSFAEDNNDE